MTRREVVFVVWGPVERADVPGVCERLKEQLERSEPGGTLVVDVADLGPGDAAALDLLARIRLAADRPVRFSHMHGRLRQLVEWVGLGHLLQERQEHQRQQEQRERREQRAGPECADRPDLWEHWDHRNQWGR
ncbi:STAS domain-containing protein [Streptomyces sp. B6B3]|uniref:STAS domain-containing protein n=1 Tax=Streptomyces sp. B6B3 TaxID=3153570 RepID=UPI00325E3DC3